MNFRRLYLGIVSAFIIAVATAAAGLGQTVLQPNDELPQPLPATAAPVTPAPVASGGPKRGKRTKGPEAGPSPSAEPSDTPEPPQFSTLDGIWEVEMQPLGSRLARYSHLSISVTGSTISGYYEHAPGRTRSAMTGTFDGRLISMQITMPNGTTAQMSGYVESFADMVGLFHTSDTDPGTAFTAQHRKKIKG